MAEAEAAVVPPAEAEPVPAEAPAGEASPGEAAAPKAVVSTEEKEARRMKKMLDPSRSAVLKQAQAASSGDWAAYQPLKRQAAKPAAGLKAKRAPAPKPRGAYAQAPSALPSAGELSLTAGEAEAMAALEEHSGLPAELEERPFLPPPTPVPGEGLGADRSEGHYKALSRRLKRELANVQRRAASELEASTVECARLKADVAALEEMNRVLSEQLHSLGQSLVEVKRESEAEIAANSRLGQAAERRAAAMAAKLGLAAADQERAYAAAAKQVEALRRERDALAQSLAAVAEAAVGGKGAAPADVAAEAEAAAAEGGDPLPRRLDAWVGYSYGGAAPAVRKGKGATDGERAVAALVAAVARLHRHRTAARRKEKDAVLESQALTDHMGRVEKEYAAVVEGVEAVEAEVAKLQQQSAIAGLAPSQAGKGLTGRLKGVTHVLARLVAYLVGRDDERTKMQAQIVELDFYAKLHAKLVEQAKSAPAAAA